MADSVPRDVRRRTMQAVRSRNTTPELMLRRALYERGLRGYRVNSREVMGSPDIAFTRRRVAVFVDGCFWHGCKRCYRAPKSHVDYWGPKVARNKARDRRVDSALRKDGWRVVRVWEHDISKAMPLVLRRIDRILNQRGAVSA